MKNNFPIIIVVILLALFYVSSINKPNNAPSSASPLPAPSATPIAETNNLIADEKFILSPPSPNASASAKQMHEPFMHGIANQDLHEDERKTYPNGPFINPSINPLSVLMAYIPNRPFSEARVTNFNAEGICIGWSIPTPIQGGSRLYLSETYQPPS